MLILDTDEISEEKQWTNRTVSVIATNTEKIISSNIWDQYALKLCHPVCFRNPVWKRALEPIIKYRL